MLKDLPNFRSFARCFSGKCLFEPFPSCCPCSSAFERRTNGTAGT